MSSSRVALVTGANQGIGYGIVRRLCKEHPTWTIYGTSRSDANGKKATEDLKAEGHNAKFLQMDLTDESSVKCVKEFLEKEHGGLDVFVNNAGIAFKMASTESYAVKAQVTLQTNVFGTADACKHIFPILKDGARVVIVSSLVVPMTLNKLKKTDPAKYEAFTKDPPLSLDSVMNYMQDFVESVKAGNFAQKGWPDDASYGISKVGNALMARAMQIEFDKTPERDIVVNAADPGYVNTNMTSFKGKLTIDEGADTPYYVAVLPPKTDIKGKFVSKREVRELA